MVFGLCQDVSLDQYIPGFPTFQHIPHRVFTHMMVLASVHCSLSLSLPLSLSLCHGAHVWSDRLRLLTEIRVSEVLLSSHKHWIVLCVKLKVW